MLHAQAPAGHPHGYHKDQVAARNRGAVCSSSGFLTRFLIFDFLIKMAFVRPKFKMRTSLLWHDHRLRRQRWTTRLHFLFFSELAATCCWSLSEALSLWVAHTSSPPSHLAVDSALLLRPPPSQRRSPLEQEEKGRRP